MTMDIVLHKKQNSNRAKGVGVLIALEKCNKCQKGHVFPNCINGLDMENPF
jgi:hypothetical protein